MDKKIIQLQEEKKEKLFQFCKENGYENCMFISTLSDMPAGAVVIVMNPDSCKILMSIQEGLTEAINEILKKPVYTSEKLYYKSGE